jgi:hypothetical protein
MKKWFSLGIVLFFGIIIFSWIFKTEDNTPVIIEIPIEEEMITEDDVLDTILVNEHNMDFDSLCFEGAFRTARHLYGPDSTFMWYGNKYHTNYFEETVE